jgi:hypothetical protein
MYDNVHNWEISETIETNREPRRGHPETEASEKEHASRAILGKVHRGFPSGIAKKQRDRAFSRL